MEQQARAEYIASRNALSMHVKTTSTMWEALDVVVQKYQDRCMQRSLFPGRYMWKDPVVCAELVQQMAELRAQLDKHA